ncbi:MAG: SDR family NAD(P)-dependent oxidoreductase, partial [Bacteroidota bacterium]
MDLNLKDRRAFVCGSTQGIGKAIAIELANMGAEIVLIARNEDILKATLQELTTQHTNHHQYLVADFDHPEQLKSQLNDFLDQNKSGEILINNSGGPAGGQAIDAALEEFRIAFNRHLICNQLLTQALVPQMKKEAFGRIINIISTSVKMPIPGLGVSNTIRGAVGYGLRPIGN